MADKNVQMKVLDTFDKEYPLNECARMFRSSETGAAVIVDECGGPVYLVDVESMQEKSVEEAEVEHE